MLDYTPVRFSLLEQYVVSGENKLPFAHYLNNFIFVEKIRQSLKEVEQGKTTKYDEKIHGLL